MPDDHSEVVPLLPIPNRTVKHLSADDSAGSRVKVGHRQASIEKVRAPDFFGALFFFVRRSLHVCAPLERANLPTAVVHIVLADKSGVDGQDQ